MRKRYGIIFIRRMSGGLILAVATLTMIVNLPCYAQEKGKEKEKQEKSIWVEEEPRGPRGPRGGPRWFELTDETIEQIMKDLAKSEPAKAAELSKLRGKDPEKFKEELRTAAREHFDKVIRERMDARRRQMQADYIEWLAKNYPEEAEKLAVLKEKDPNLYIKKFRLSMEQKERIFEAARENPELGEILKDDLELKEKVERLLKKIKSAGSENEKKELTVQLQQVEGRRFDLIVKRKEIAYAQLLKKLEELKKHLEENKAEITKWKDAKFKEENVKKHIEDLIKGLPKFKWD